MTTCALTAGVTRREVLKLGGGALVAGTAARVLDLAAPPAATAQSPKRGGIFRIATQLDPVGLDPHQTIAFATMTMLSFTHSRLVKVKAGPSVRPGTYPVEADVAESWTQPTDTTYLFKLRKGVRWHNKPPVNGRELTAEDAKYTYERFLTIKGNGNRPLLESLDKVEALDRYTVKLTLKEPNAWFIDLLASTSTWLIAREAVEKFGDLKRAEAVIGTGPWMLERYEPDVRLVFVRNPDYFVRGLPYADGVDVTVDPDPSSRLASWLAGTYDFGPEYQQVVRRLDLDLARRRKPGLQTAEYIWFTGGYSSFRLDHEPFKDVRVRRAMGRAISWKEGLEISPYSQGQGAPNPAVPAASAEWSIPIDQLPQEGRELYEQDVAAARRLLGQAGHPNGFKTNVETTAGYGPDYMDGVQVVLRNWKEAGIETDVRLKEYGAFISSTIFGKFDKIMIGLRGSWLDPHSYLYRAFLPGQPLNSSGVDDPKLSDMINLQRRTFDVTRRREIVYDIQRHISRQAYYLYGGSARVVSAWEPYVKNWAPNNGFDYGGRLMAAWLDR
jgi:peptide/nickel transport system substrate-binding protein